MIDINSNCSRVDAVKARATQLRMQLDQMPRATPESEAHKKAASQVQSLDAAVKKEDAQKAETVLSSATSAVQELQAKPASELSTQRGLDAYA